MLHDSTKVALGRVLPRSFYHYLAKVWSFARLALYRRFDRGIFPNTANGGHRLVQVVRDLGWHWDFCGDLTVPRLPRIFPSRDLFRPRARVCDRGVTQCREGLGFVLSLVETRMSPLSPGRALRVGALTHLLSWEFAPCFWRALVWTRISPLPLGWAQ